MINYLMIYGLIALNAIFILEISKARYQNSINKYTYLAFIVIACLTVGSMMNFTHIPKTHLMLLSYTVYTLLVFYLLKLRILSSIFVVGIILIFTGLGELLSYLIIIKLLGYTVQQVQSLPLLILLANLMPYLMLVALTWFLRKNPPKLLRGTQKNDVKTSLIVYICLILLITGINLHYLMNEMLTYEQMYSVNIIIFAGFALSNIVFVLNNYRYKQQVGENEQLKMYVATIDKLSCELRRFKHNYLNLLHGMSGYIENEKWGELKSYYAEIIDESRALNNNNVFSFQKIKNYALFGLLENKIMLAESHGIKILLEANQKIEEIPMKMSALCEVLGVFLDNAIEAATTSPKKEMEVYLRRDSKYLSIRIENTFAQNADQINIPKLSSKKYSSKGDNRGIGLYTAKGLIKEYDNILWNTTIEGDKFVQELIIH